MEKQNRAQGDHAIKVFEKHGVDIITHKDGKKSTGEITNLTPEMIDELAQGPWHPRQIQTLREISRSLREGDGERAGFLIGYFAASTGRKPKAVPFALRQEMPYGFKLTKDGNILALLHDVPQLEKNLKFLKGGRRLPGKYRDEYNQLFDNDTEVWEAFRQYRVNTANGMDGQLGLDDDPARAIRKKNFLNALHGAIDKEQINLNPILSEISKLKGMDMFNPSKRQPFGPATKTFRLDRIFDVTRSGNRNSNVNIDRVKKLLMPRESKGFDKRVALRTNKDVIAEIEAEAKARGVSINDILNERIRTNVPPAETPQPKTPENQSDIALTSEELRLLKKTNIGPEDAEAYRQAVEKRRKLAEASILGEKLFMPTIEERKASKYGKQLSEAQRLDKSIISDARKEWNELGYEAPNFQRFMKLEDEFGADPPALATLQNNGNFKPQELYYVGDMGVAKNANYDAVINIRKRLFDEVDRQESHRWNEDETITVTTDRKKARELQKKLDPDHVPLVLASNAKYIFDPSNPEHIASLKLPEGESFSANPVDVSLFEPEIKARGWHGYRVGDEISIFDSTRLKLIKDQSAETKLFSKDRPFGKVSGLFGQKTPLDRFDSSTSKDLRFMPLSEEIKARNEWLSKTFSSKNFQDFITRKGKPNFALKNKDGDYLPVPWYHGGTIGEGNRGKLKDWTFNDNYIWLSSEKDFSLEFSMYRGADPFLYEAQIRSASDVGNPIMVATNASNVFHYANPKHIKKLRENSALDYYEIEDLKLGEWYDVEPHLKLLRDLGFDGARMKQDGTENVVIFNRKDIKLIQDVNDVGRSVEVSGKFIGEQLFLPQLKFDFDSGGSAVEMSPVSKDRAPTFWKLFKINPKDPKVYDKVADVLIDTGTPSNDPANALDHAGKLGLDPKKLRQAMARAQRRYFNQIGRFYMPTAYHGTPHTLAPEPGAPLGKFRTSAIGTGEGAQAYGHGLYFAGKREVADYYRRELSSNIDESFLKYDGQPFDLSNPKHEAARMLSREAKALGKSKNQVRPRLISLTRERIQGGGLHPSVRERIKNVLKVLENKQEAKTNEGSLYKVKLAPKENEYLLWDKPLSEQPKGVRDIFIKKYGKEEFDLVKDDLAQEWYRSETDYFGSQEQASQSLKEAGIPGIKYLDGSSRSKGEGDYNYVIFDEADVTVTEKLFMPASEAGAGKGKQAEAADLDFKISTRNPTAKNATENPITEDLIINTASIADDATMLESHALALQEYPGIKRNSKVPKRIIDSFVDHVVDNLLYLHDQVRPEVRDRSKLWYDGAKNITEKWNQKYGNDKQAIAAALASLSPQKDWFMNVDLARRMLDIYKDQSGFAFDKAMAKKYIQLFEKGIGKKKATEIAEAMVGKTLNELQSDFEQAAFIRSYDEVYNPREYQVVSPEGDFIGLAKSLDGVNKKVAWGSMTEISKAVKVLRNPSKESISTALGNAHKIRNFYNNILLPNADEFSVTIDTHAIAAALLRPLAGADLEVANNFGSKPKGAKRSIKNSSVKGISGTYGIYADAYRKAAEARGILPREMQSITWEAVRGLYEAKWKTKSNKAKIDNLWKKYENGELTLNETREQILESAGGITEPEWVTERSNSGADGTNESANKSQELYRPELGGSELRANPRRGRTNSRGSQEVNFLPAGNFSRQPANRITRQAPAMPGNRFMLPAASAGAKSAERFR